MCDRFASRALAAFSILAFALTTAPTSAQVPPDASDESVIHVRLEPRSPEGNARPRWSPKGVKLSLEESADGLVTQLSLGPQGLEPVALRLEEDDGSRHWNRLRVDRDRNGLDPKDIVLNGMKEASVFGSQSRQKNMNDENRKKLAAETIMENPEAPTTRPISCLLSPFSLSKNTASSGIMLPITA